MDIEIRLMQIDNELPRHCITRQGRILVDEPIGHGELVRRAVEIGRDLALPVVEVADTGERTTLYRPAVSAYDPHAHWPAGSHTDYSPAAG